MDISSWLPARMRKNALVCGVLLALGGCATVAQSPFEPSNQDLARIESKTTVDAIREAEMLYSQSQHKDVAYLAPQHFDMAERAIEDAKNLLTSNQSRDKIVEKVAVAETVMRNGQLVARKVKATLKDELEIKESLDALNAPKLYSGEYGSLIDRLSQIIRQIENGQKDDVEVVREQLRKQMTDLETRSLRHVVLGEAEEILKRVKNSGGEKLAPMTYEDAVAVLKRADQFIAENPHMRDAVKQMGDEAMFAAKRALYITQEVAALSHKVNTSLEQVVLDEEYRLYRVARAMNNREDFRDNPLELQSELLARSVGDLQAQHEKQEGLVVALRDTLIKVRDSAGFVAATNSVQQLRQEKGELMAKEALYSAKVAQLNTELTQKNTTITELEQELQTLRQQTALLEAQTQQVTDSTTVEEQAVLPVKAADVKSAEAQAVANIPELTAAPERPDTQKVYAPETVDTKVVATPAAAPLSVASPEPPAPAPTIAEQVQDVIEASAPPAATAESPSADLIESTTELVKDTLRAKDTEPRLPLTAESEPAAIADAVETQPVTRDDVAAMPKMKVRSLDVEDDLSVELEALAADQ